MNHIIISTKHSSDYIAIDLVNKQGVKSTRQIAIDISCDRNGDHIISTIEIEEAIEIRNALNKLIVEDNRLFNKRIK